jgi:mono/diheme cytochrome c family protein
MMRANVAAGWIAGVVLFPAMVVAQTAKPSFGKEIAPILHEKCAQCHRPGEVAPMSLMSYEEVRPWVRAIKTKVVSRQMPPWYAEGEHGKWRNDRRLSQADIDKIVAWVDAGAPRGSDAVPDPPQLAHGWNHPSGRPPDLIIEAPEFKVAAEGEVPWWYANVKLPFQGDVWVEAAQVVPGNRAVVHHVLVTSATLPSDAPATELVAGAPTSELLARGAGAAPRQPRGEAAGGANAVGGFGEFSAGWEPGVDAAHTLGDGVGQRLSGTHLRFNMHYQPNGHETTDKTRLGLWLQKGPINYKNAGLGIGLGQETFIINGKELTGRFTAQVTQDVLPRGTKTVPNIPAGADSYRLTALVPIRTEILLHSIQPHMHLRGKSSKYTAIYPDGREEELINVPHYDFNWQIIYEFAKPVTLPAGTTVRIEAVYDNSTKNKYNPRPDQEVFWGEQSWDEMFSTNLNAVVHLASPIIPGPPPTLESRR